MVPGRSITAARQSAGLAVDELARATGTPVRDLEAYESGRDVAPPSVLRRIDAAVVAGADSPIFVHKLLTVPATAAAIRAGLRDGWSTSDLLRLVRESRSNAKWLATPADLAAFFVEPPTTEDPRWDALLAGSTEELALSSRRDPPTWTAGHAIRPFWFVGTDEAFDAYALAHSPASLKIRGVILDAAELASI